MSGFTTQVADLLERAGDVVAAGPDADRLALLRARLDEPLRIAVAGRLKAGKSTLLNAIVGEPLATTGTAECTRVVTWYREGVTYRATVLTVAGEERVVQVRRGEASVEIDLDGMDAEAVDRLIVEWPARSLRRLTLLDTPGIATLSEEIAERTSAALLDDDPSADAVIYLLRHLHAADAAFLDSWLAASGPGGGATAIGVLSRADEVGGGGPDAMAHARRVAARYAAEPQVRQRCADVVAVAGLLAQAATTLTESEFRAVSVLAAAGRERGEALLLTAGRVTAADDGCGLTDVERAHLLGRMGLFGLRLAVSLVRLGVARTAGELAAELTQRSGLGQLRELLEARFASRAGLLKARRAAHVLDRLLAADGTAAARLLRMDLERVLATTHELDELRLLGGLRAGTSELPPRLHDVAARLVGRDGPAAGQRLGVDGDAAQRSVLGEALGWFQQVAVHPVSSPRARAEAQTVIRTLEGLHQELV